MMPSNTWLKSGLIIPFVSLFVVLAAWGTTSPIGSSPDEPFHIASIWCATGKIDEHCLSEKEIGSGRKEVTLPFTVDICFGASPSTSAACSSNGELIPQVNEANTTLGPNGFYRAMHVFVSSNPLISVLRMRIFNALLATFCFAMVLVLAPRRLKIAFIGSWVVTLIPMGLSLMSSINPSSWTITAGATNWVFLITAITSARKSKQQLGAWAMWSFTLLIALSSRHDGLYIALATNLIALFALYGLNTRALKRFAPWIAGAALLCLSLAQVRRTIGYFTIFSTSINTYPDRSFVQWFVFNVVHVIEIPLGTWGGDWGAGGIRSFGISPPPLVSAIGLTMFIATLTVALRQPNRKQMLALSSAALLITVPIFQMLNHYRFLIGDMVTSRYILPAMPFVIGIALYTSTNAQEFIQGRSSKKLLVILFTISHSVTLYTVLQRYISGNDGFYRLIDTTNGWWWKSMPVGPNLVWLIGSLMLPVALMSWIKAIELDQ